MNSSVNKKAKCGRQQVLRCGLLLISILLLLTATVNAAAESGECSVPKELTVKPPKIDGKPVKVSIGIFLLDLIEIDEIKQSFKIDYTVDIRWHDPRLSVKSLGKSLVGCSLSVGDVWDPRLQAINPFNMDLTMSCSRLMKLILGDLIVLVYLAGRLFLMSVILQGQL
ncbi:MAG: hypothetical protein P8Y28_06755 [Gammaproteobacteria bacterium]